MRLFKSRQKKTETRCRCCDDFLTESELTLANMVKEPYMAFWCTRCIRESKGIVCPPDCVPIRERQLIEDVFFFTHPEGYMYKVVKVDIREGVNKIVVKRTRNVSGRILSDFSYIDGNSQKWCIIELPYLRKDAYKNYVTND